MINQEDLQKIADILYNAGVHPDIINELIDCHQECQFNSYEEPTT